MGIFDTKTAAPVEKLVLLMQVPRTNDKKELAAEQMFASLHGLLTFPPEKRFAGNKIEAISLEIAVIGRVISFYVCIPKYLKSFVEEQIYAQYPTVQIHEVDDYSASYINGGISVGTELKLTDNDVLPIKTFQSFEVDPLAAITATLAKFDESEEAWIQLVIKPADKNWHKKNERYVNGMRTGTKSGSSNVLGALWNPPEYNKTETAAKLTEYEQAKAKSAEEKSHKLGFSSTVRIVYRGNVSPPEATLRLQSIIAGFKQFNTTYLNGFEQGKVIYDGSMARSYNGRTFSRAAYVLNIEEVATLFHLPHTNVETPYIKWASAQTSEPPTNLPVVSSSDPDTISPIAGATFRGLNTPFGMPRIDRERHLYIIGQTGVGKSALLELLTISEINSPYGFAVIDPHGDYALNILRRIPKERAKDVIYFNPVDVNFPIAFNPMEVQDSKLKTQTASELIGVLKRMFDSWGPRLEYILRYCLLALLEYPEATMLDITRILTDRKFRDEVLKYVHDPVVHNFWTVEFASWNDKFAAEAVAPVLNKVGAFTANPVVRNIIGQPKSSFNIREIMDSGKIFIVNLSRGLVGEDNAAIIGALLVTKIQLAAMGRADTPAEQRRPFYLYVDEFQNFATESFATILSEARKYALCLTVANQYVAQMPQEVKDAVFGNVGSMIAFRMGADDSRTMQRYFEPKFTEYDLIHMHNRHFVINMTIDGEKSPAFSAITLDLPPTGTDYTDAIIEHSRSTYSLPLAEVETHVNNRYVRANLPSSAPERPTYKPKKPVHSPVINETAKTEITDETDLQKIPNPEALDLDSKHPETRSILSPLSVGRTVLGLKNLTEPKKKRKRTRSRKRKTSDATMEIIKPKVIKPTKPSHESSNEPKNFTEKDEEIIFKR